MRKKAGILFALVVIVFCAAGLAAQSYDSFQYELEDIKENRTRWRIGPFRLSPRILIRDIGYDDNVYGQRDDEDPISDYTATLSPELQIHLIFRDWLILYLYENPEYVFFFKESKERAFNHSFTPGFKISPLRGIVISGEYRYSKKKIRVTSEFNSRTFEVYHMYSGSLFYESSRSTMLGIRGLVRDFYYEDITFPEEALSLSRILNHREKRAEAEFYYRIFSRSYLFLKGGYATFDFFDKDSSWRDVDSYNLIGGIRFPLKGRIRGLLSLGYKTLDPRAEGRERYSGLVANTSFDYKIGRFVFRIEYLRDNFFSFSQENIYFIENRYGGGLSFYLSQFIRLDYRYSYGDSFYPEAIQVFNPDVGFESLKRRDVYNIHTISFVIRFMKNTGIGISMNFWKRDSNLNFADRERMFIGGYITQDF